MLELTWTTARIEEVPASDTWLGEQERAVLSGMRAGPRRDSFRLGRFAAKRLLGQVEVLPTPQGPPAVFRSGARLPISLSLSHRDGVGLCAAVSGEVALGCDLERVEPRSFAFARAFLTDRERAALARASDASECANLIWSAKESALKALHVGLARDTWEIEVVVQREGTWVGSHMTVRRVGDSSEPESEPTPWRDLVIRDHGDGQLLRGGWRRLDGFVATWVCGGLSATAEPLHASAEVSALPRLP